MKKFLALFTGMAFLLMFSVNPVLAWGGHHGGHYYHHGYYNGGHHHHYHTDWWPWGVFGIGLGAAIIGDAIINSAPPEREVVVVPPSAYIPPPPPQCQCPPDDEVYTGPAYSHERVWIPGQYARTDKGHYIYVPGHWED